MAYTYILTYYKLPELLNPYTCLMSNTLTGSNIIVNGRVQYRVQYLAQYTIYIIMTCQLYRHSTSWNLPLANIRLKLKMNQLKYLMFNTNPVYTCRIDRTPSYPTPHQPFLMKHHYTNNEIASDTSLSNVKSTLDVPLT